MGLLSNPPEPVYTRHGRKHMQLESTYSRISCQDQRILFPRVFCHP